MHVLVIEDDADVAASLCEYLEQGGHVVDAATDGMTGLHLVTAHHFDAIVLDLGLPGVDGLTLCRQIRDRLRKSTPVLMLTARDTLEDKLAGFESGADDYLVKPFALAELEARLRALSERVYGRGKTRELRVADLSFDLDALKVKRGGKEITLTRVGLRILELLMRESHRVVPRREIEQALWGGEPPESDVLRTHIHALRSAIDRPFDVALLHTMPGIGYRLSAPEESDG
jgi:DNA-binding response OmpR family regulator